MLARVCVTGPVGMWCRSGCVMEERVRGRTGAKPFAPRPGENGERERALERREKTAFFFLRRPPSCFTILRKRETFTAFLCNKNNQ